MQTTDKYAGLDVHKDTTVVAVAEGGRTGKVRLFPSGLPRCDGGGPAIDFPLSQKATIRERVRAATAGAAPAPHWP